jgi:hemerythrin-like domain-containing protein
MKFIVDRASDSWKVEPTEVEMNTLEELIDFIKKE